MTQLNTSEYTANQLMQYLMTSSYIDINSVAKDMKQKEKDAILKQHATPITQGSDGRWRTRVKENGKRKQIVKSTREKVEEALVDFYKSAIASNNKVVTLADLFSEWIAYKELHGSAPTYIKRLKKDWKNHYQGTSIIDKPITEINKFMCDIWAHELIKKVKGSKKQYYNISHILRGLLDYAEEKELISSNPFRKVKINGKMVFTPQRKPSSETQVFTYDELEKLKDTAWDDFKNGHNTVQKLAPLAVLFQLQSGLRIGELCVVKYEDLINDTEIYIHRMYRYEDKEVVDYVKGRNAGRTVILTTEARHLIETARKYQQENNMNDNGYIFSINDEPLSYYAIRKLYARYCDAIGTINKSSHKARKTYISSLIDGGVNINTVRELVGHADEKTTLKSYCFDRSNQSDRAKLIENALNNKKS